MDSSLTAIRRRRGISDADAERVAKYMLTPQINDEELMREPDFGKRMVGMGKFSDTGRESSGFGEALDSLTGAPLRVGLDDMAQNGASFETLKKIAKSIGKDPRSAPTGYDVATHMGIENPYAGTAVATAVDMANLPVGELAAVAGKLPGVMGTVKKMAPEAEALLAKIKTPEAAVALKGQEREAYLKALDEVYGDRAKRAADMGFSDETWYHGTGHDFDQFSLKNANQSGRNHTPAFFFTDNPETADEFAGHSASHVNLKNHPSWTRLMEKAGGDAEKAADLSRDAALTGENILPVRLKLPEKGSLLRTIATSDARGGIPRSNSIDRGLKNDPYVLFKNAADSPMENFDNLSSVAAMKNANDIRSVNAAFDPRFKDSPLLLAGQTPGGAIDLSQLAAIRALRQKRQNENKK